MTAADVLGLVVLAAGLTACEPPPTPAPGPPTGQEPTKDPGEVDDALIEAIQQDRYEDAYGLMSAPYRATVSLATFEAAVSKNVYLKNSREIGCWNVSTKSQPGATIHIRECILKSEVGDTKADLFYTLENGEWRMTGILLGGTPAFPGHEPGANAVVGEE